MFTTEFIARCAGSCKLKSAGRDGVTAGGVAGAAAAGGEGCGVCGTSEVFGEQPASCMPSRMIPPASGGVIRRPRLRNIKEHTPSRTPTVTENCYAGYAIRANASYYSIAPRL